MMSPFLGHTALWPVDLKGQTTEMLSERLHCPSLRFLKELQFEVVLKVLFT